MKLCQLENIVDVKFEWAYHKKRIHLISNYLELKLSALQKTT